MELEQALTEMGIRRHDMRAFLTNVHCAKRNPKVHGDPTIKDIVMYGNGRTRVLSEKKLLEVIEYLTAALDPRLNLVEKTKEGYVLTERGEELMPGETLFTGFVKRTPNELKSAGARAGKFYNNVRVAVGTRPNPNNSKYIY